MCIIPGGQENLSLDRPTLQSSTDAYGASNKAVDGYQLTTFNLMSCSSTLPSTNPWWAVDLEHSYLVQEVKITNRGDCCGEYHW